MVGDLRRFRMVFGLPEPCAEGRAQYKIIPQMYNVQTRDHLYTHGNNKLAGSVGISFASLSIQAFTARLAVLWTQQKDHKTPWSHAYVFPPSG